MLPILYSMKKEHVSNKLTEIRKEQNITQQGLANAVNVSRQTIISIEKGNYTPSVLLALKIVKTLSAKVEDVFSIK